MDKIIVLSNIKPFLIVVGMWPAHLFKHKFQQILYKIWIVSYYCFLYCFILLQMVDIVVETTNKNYDQVSEVCNTFLLYLVNNIKILIYKSKRIAPLFEELGESQDHYLNGEDDKAKTIFLKYAKTAKRLNALFIILIISIMMTFYTNAYALFPRRKPPLGVWVPPVGSDDGARYYTGLVLCLVMGPVASLMYIVVQTLLIIFVVNITGRLKILQHILANLEDYAAYVQTRDGIDNDSATFVVVRYCALEHKKIIRFVKTLNDSLKYPLLLEFMLNSLQLATVLFTFIAETNWQTWLFALNFVIIMLTQLFALYWHASEVKDQSVLLGLAIYQSNWYLQPKRIQTCLHLMMMRADRPLTFTIGQFYEISMETTIVV